MSLLALARAKGNPLSLPCCKAAPVAWETTCDTRSSNLGVYFEGLFVATRKYRQYKNLHKCSLFVHSSSTRITIFYCKQLLSRFLQHKTLFHLQSVYMVSIFEGISHCLSTDCSLCSLRSAMSVPILSVIHDPLKAVKNIAVAGEGLQRSESPRRFLLFLHISCSSHCHSLAWSRPARHRNFRRLLFGNGDNLQVLLIWVTYLTTTTFVLCIWWI